MQKHFTTFPEALAPLPMPAGAHAVTEKVLANLGEPQELLGVPLNSKRVKL